MNINEKTDGTYLVWTPGASSDWAIFPSLDLALQYTQLRGMMVNAITRING